MESYTLDVNDIRPCKTGISIGYKPIGCPKRRFLSLGRKPDETDMRFIKAVYRAGEADCKKAFRDLLEIKEST